MSPQLEAYCHSFIVTPKRGVSGVLQSISDGWKNQFHDGAAPHATLRAIFYFFIFLTCFPVCAIHVLGTQDKRGIYSCIYIYGHDALHVVRTRQYVLLYVVGGDRFARGVWLKITIQ